MARFLFPQWTDKFRHLVTLLLAGGPVYLIVLLVYGAKAETLRVGYQPKQPIPYSHALHVGELGLDCRYCHSTVEQSGHAAIPAPATCLNCHHAVRSDSPFITPIFEAAYGGAPLKWVRVHDLPDYVYFNHSAHVRRGVGCESCHGRIDRMVEVYQAKTLTMEWCLDCHNDPTSHLRDPSQVTVMGYDPPGGARSVGEKIRKDNNIKPPTNCSTCHR
jgi:menaquinone reductase, multiheme cytochrome c subunit